MNYNKSLFEGVPKAKDNKSRFNHSHEWKSQMQIGFLVPVLTEEMLPGDKIELSQEFMFRFASLYFPIMHKLTMRCDTYWIPNRILWPGTLGFNEGWQKWISEDAELDHPVVDANMLFDTTAFSNQIMGFMGIPLIAAGAGINTKIQGLNAFPLSAYLKIYDEYVRVPQLEDPIWFPLEPGDNTSSFQTALNDGGLDRYYPCLSAKWEKDYFTSALPTPQIGEAILIPLVRPWSTEFDGSYHQQTLISQATGLPAINEVTIATDASGFPLGGIGGQAVYLDISASADTIKALRTAEVLQHYYERIMKIGQRYRDFIEGMWGNDPEPNTIDRPVLIGSKFGRVQISDVMTQANYDYPAEAGNSRTGDYTGQANLYSQDNDTIRYTCPEHGWLMSILQVNPNTNYGQGIERKWRRSVQTDYALDMFSSIGDQEILKEEVLYNALTAEAAKNQETFGYIPRFSEYRYKNNMYLMQLGHTGGLSQTLGRYWDPADITGTDYDNLIQINNIFTKSQTGIIGGTRSVDVFRVLPSGGIPDIPSEGVIYAHIFHSLYITRNLPMFSTPKL